MDIGQLVKSLAGRDKGRHYLVIGVEGRNLLLSDGQNRPVMQPKKKNPKHLQPYNCFAPGLKEKLQNNALQDLTVRNTLQSLLAGKCAEENALPGSIPGDSSF